MVDVIEAHWREPNGLTVVPRPRWASDDQVVPHVDDLAQDTRGLLIAAENLPVKEIGDDSTASGLVNERRTMDCMAAALPLDEQFAVLHLHDSIPRGGDPRKLSQGWNLKHKIFMQRSCAET